jgi:mRNA turnover protein 4
VTLSKVKAHRKDRKHSLLEKIQESVDKFDRVFVFTYENMRSSKFKDVRGLWSDSRFFLGKNRVMQVALGSTEADEFRPQLSQLSADLSGNVGLLFTSRPQADVEAFFADFSAPDYARSGNVAHETVVVPAGPLPDVPHTMCDELRKLGMDVKLVKGAVVVARDHTICTEGDALTPEQCRLLKHFSRELAEFRLRLLSAWHDGVFTNLTVQQDLLAAGAAGTKGAKGRPPARAHAVKQKRPAPRQPGKAKPAGKSSAAAGDAAEDSNDDDVDSDDEDDDSGDMSDDADED